MVVANVGELGVLGDVVLDVLEIPRQALVVVSSCDEVLPTMERLGSRTHHTLLLLACSSLCRCDFSQSHPKFTTWAEAVPALRNWPFMDFDESRLVARGLNALRGLRGEAPILRDHMMNVLHTAALLVILQFWKGFLSAEKVEKLGLAVAFVSSMSCTLSLDNALRTHFTIGVLGPHCACKQQELVSASLVLLQWCRGSDMEAAAIRHTASLFRETFAPEEKLWEQEISDDRVVRYIGKRSSGVEVAQDVCKECDHMVEGAVLEQTLRVFPFLVSNDLGCKMLAALFRRMLHQRDQSKQHWGFLRSVSLRLYQDAALALQLFERETLFVAVFECLFPAQQAALTKRIGEIVESSDVGDRVRRRRAVLKICKRVHTFQQTLAAFYRMRDGVSPRWLELGKPLVRSTCLI